MKAQLIQTVEQTMEISADLQKAIEYWTPYVTEPFAMAPTTRRQQGITPLEYQREGTRYFMHDRKFMLPYLHFMKQHQGDTVRDKTFLHAGCGHGDDSGYVADALKLGFDLEIRDIVKPARDKTIRRIKNTYRRKDLCGLELRDPRHFVEFGDLEEIVASGSFNPRLYSGCKVGRLLYHYGKKRLDKILRNMATLITESGRLIILIHHVPDLNYGYQYKTSFPYTLLDIMEPIQEVAPGARILNAKTFDKDTLWRYFDCQNLTWLAIGQPD